MKNNSPIQKILVRRKTKNFSEKSDINIFTPFSKSESLTERWTLLSASACNVLWIHISHIIWKTSLHNHERRVKKGKSHLDTIREISLTLLTLCKDLGTKECQGHTCRATALTYHTTLNPAGQAISGLFPNSLKTTYWTADTGNNTDESQKDCYVK